MHNSLLQAKLSFSQQINTLITTQSKPLTLIRPRLFLWLFFLLPMTLVSSCSANNANAYSYSITPKNYNNEDSNKDNLSSNLTRVNILNSFLLKEKIKNELPFTELSDLAWDEDEQLLYAISDEGLLYHLKIEVKNKQLKAVTVISAMKLKGKNKQALTGKNSDAEGLAIRHSNNGKRGDSKLIISFERKPRIAIYSTDGHFIRKVKTIKKLRKRKSYRGENSALESVAFHPIYGVITASEKPLKANPKSKQTIYSSKGKEWHFAASKVKNSSITAIEVISKNKILILERAHNGLLSPIVISLRQLNINKCDSKNFCEIENIARFDSSEGWILDNFEGLTHFRNNQYLMVSDDNNSPLQKTLLVFFEIIDK